MRALIFVLSAAYGGIAQASTGLFGRDTVTIEGDARAVLADGERAWADGGYGKARYGAGRPAGDFALASADIIWEPHLSWTTKAVIDLMAQPEQYHGVEINQAYVQTKSAPHGAWKWDARAGYFYPPISLEHEGADWRVADTITPSALNSWVGEELKVLGGEATLAPAFAGHELAASVGVFTNDDTAGTLLTYRGWALHDVRAGAQGRFPLPPLTSFGAMVQDPYTESSLEIDDRAGYYGRLQYAPSESTRFHLFYYDNRGNRTGVIRTQWAWDTRFWEAGARFWPTPVIKITAQAMHGTTAMGFAIPELFADVDFNAAYAAGTRTLGDDGATARLDWFNVEDKSLVAIDDNNEEGWAATLAYRHKISARATLIVEGLHIDSDRPSRPTAGEPAHAQDSTLQASLRFRM